MTDISKYANVSLSKSAYNQLREQSKKVYDVKISVSKTVELASNILQHLLNDPMWVKPYVGSPAYSKFKKQLMEDNYGAKREISH